MAPGVRRCARSRSSTSRRRSSRRRRTSSRRYDVIVFPPTGIGPRLTVAAACRCGATRFRGRRRTSRRTSARPTRPTTCGRGSDLSGVANLRRFVAEGGLLVTAMDTSELAVEYGLAPGVSIADSEKLKLTGSVVRAKLVDAHEPDRVRLSRESRRSFPSTGRSSTSPTWPGRRGNRRFPRSEGAARRAAARRTIPISWWAARSRKPPSRPRPRRGRRCRSPTSSAATIPSSSRPRTGRACLCGTATPRTCSSRACSREAARSRSIPRSWTSRSRRGTWCSSRTTRSGAARPAAASSLVFNAILNWDGLNAGTEGRQGVTDSDPSSRGVFDEGSRAISPGMALKP